MPPRRLLELTANQCRWPVSGDDVRGVDILFCAAPAADDCSYCAAHMRMAHRGPGHNPEGDPWRMRRADLPAVIIIAGAADVEDLPNQGLA